MDLKGHMDQVTRLSSRVNAELRKKNIEGAIQETYGMLKVMCTSALSPKYYYELYMQIIRELFNLESYLIEEHRNGRKFEMLYEQVQHFESLIPRLYLLITIGIYQIKCSKGSRASILHDLMIMCYGVGHPLRGLFLRNYLLHAFRSDFLSDIEDGEMILPYPLMVPTASTIGSCDEQLTVNIDFLLFNFCEMNKLWVRIQYQGHSRDRAKRQQERRELCILVGTNLTRLSQLENLDSYVYKTYVLPKFLSQLVQCHDVIAQQYLMDVIIQVFPDEFHACTLPLLLHTCSKLEIDVKLSSLICPLIKRLTQYAVSEMQNDHEPLTISMPVSAVVVPTDQSDMNDDDNVAEGSATKSQSTNTSKVDLFRAFYDLILSLLDSYISRSDQLNEMGTNNESYGLPPEDVPLIFLSLADLVMSLYPDQRVSLIDVCFSATATILDRLHVKTIQMNSRISHSLIQLLQLAFPQLSNDYMYCQPTSLFTCSTSSHSVGPLGNLCDILQLSGFRRLLSLLDAKKMRVRVACCLMSETLGRVHFDSSKIEDDTNKSNDLSSNYSTRFSTESDLNYLLELIDCFLVADSFGSDVGFEDPDEQAEAELIIAGAIHLLGPEPKSQDPDLSFNLLIGMQKRLSHTIPALIKPTHSALIFQAMQVMEAYVHWSEQTGTEPSDKISTVVDFVQECLAKLLSVDAPDLVLRLCLDTALVLDNLPFDRCSTIVYELIVQALTLFEDSVSNTHAQTEAIHLITNAVVRMRCFSADARKTLCTQCSRAASNLLRKPDQSRAVACTAHMFWPMDYLDRDGTKQCKLSRLETDNDDLFFNFPPVSHNLRSIEKSKELRDKMGVINCLDRSCRLARDCLDPMVKAQLFISLLNQTLQFFLCGCPELTSQRFIELSSQIRMLLSNASETSISEQTSEYYANTVNHILQLNRQTQFSSEQLVELINEFKGIKTS